MARSERTRTLREAASRYAAIAVTLGAKENEAVEQLRNAWSDVSRPLKGGDA
jgi:hypothetical protein